MSSFGKQDKAETVMCRRDLGVRLWPNSGVVEEVLIILQPAEVGEMLHGAKACRMHGTAL